jgi:alkylhydroperoxidase/carboxymuconolactone decarboxylase family protein YurZ
VPERPELAAVAEGVSARLAAGTRRLRSVLEADGAVSGADKALFTAVAACSQVQRELAASELARAKTLGITALDARSACALLLLSRGEEAFRTFVAIARDVFGADAVDGAEGDGGDITTDEALDYFREHFGEVPPRQRLFSRVSPRGFQAYCMMHQAGLTRGSMAHVRAELMLCTIIAAAAQPQLLEIHARSALAAGASHEEIVEAVLAAVPCTGFTVWASSAEVLERTQAVAAASV